MKIFIYSLKAFKIETLIKIIFFSSLETINFKRIEDSLSYFWKKDRNEPSLLFLDVIRISHALDHLFLPQSLENRREWSPSKIDATREDHPLGSRTIFFRGRFTTSTTKNLSSPWRFKTMQIPEKTILFLVSPYCLAVQRKMRQTSREVGETWPRTMLYLPWYWRSTMAKENEGEMVIWRGYGWIEPAVFLSPRKSPRGWMGSLVRGETARSHWSRSIILRYILVGSVDTRQKGKKKENSRGPRLDVADKLSSLRHWNLSQRDITAVRFSIFLPSLG